MADEKQPKVKKPFNETGFGKFVKGAGALAPEILTVVDAFVTGGKVGNAIDAVQGVLSKKAETDIAARQMLAELEKMKYEWMKEVMADEQAYFRMEVEDKASARAREIALIQAGDKNVTQNVLGYAAVAGFFGLVFYLVVHGLDDMSQEASFIIGNMLGIVAAIANNVYSYYYGTTRDSRKKTDILARNQQYQS